MSNYRSLGALAVMCCGAVLLVIGAVSLAGFGLDRHGLYTSGGVPMALNSALGWFVAGFAVVFIGMVLLSIGNSISKDENEKNAKGLS